MLGSRVHRRGAAQEGGAGAELVGVGVGRPRHLPGADPGRVGLAGRGIAQLDEVGLGLEHEHRDGQVGADPDAPVDVGGDAVLVRRRGPAAPGVDEDPLIGGVERLDGVGVGGQVEGRLRLADGQDVGGSQAAQRGRGRGTEGLADLGVHVQGVLVPGVVEGAVAGRVLLTQPLGGARSQDGLAALDAEGLGRHAHVGGPGVHQRWVEVAPVRCGLPGRDVHPLDHHVPVELRRIAGPADQHPGAVGGRVLWCDRPPTVGRRGSGGERPGGARGEPLLLDIAVSGQVERRGRDGLVGCPDVRCRSERGGRPPSGGGGCRGGRGGAPRPPAGRRSEGHQGEDGRPCDQALHAESP